MNKVFLRYVPSPSLLMIAEMKKGDYIAVCALLRVCETLKAIQEMMSTSFQIISYGDSK